MMHEQPAEPDDPSAWLGIAVAQLRTIEPGDQAARQQQQAALAVLQAIRLGATDREADNALRNAVLDCLFSALELVGVDVPTEGLTAGAAPQDS